MKSLTVLVNVPAGPKTPLRRVAGIMEDGRSFAVATMAEGSNVADTEFAFELGEAVTLSETILAGDRRAMTTPGLARILSATVAVLFRVAAEAGAIKPDGPPPATSEARSLRAGQSDEEADGRGVSGDRGEAAADEGDDGGAL